MDAVTLIKQANVAGLEFAVSGDKLNVIGPQTPQTTALVQQLAERKADIIAALKPPRPTLPPLPRDMWRTGIATFADARRHQKAITGYATRCGKGDDGFYVAGPDSGLCAVHMPYVEVDDEAVPV